jgi:molybdenum cofactor cytidylyltransferase
MGRPKPLLEFDGETFLDSLIQRFRGICSPIIVVLGYGADQVRSGIVGAGQVEFAINPAPERGMLSSLQCGLSRIPEDSGPVLFTTVDLPAISRTTIEILASGHAEVAIPTYEGRKGHPVCISRAVAVELMALPVEARADDILRRHEAKLIPVDDPNILHDVDTPGDYEALLARARR